MQQQPAFSVSYDLQSQEISDLSAYTGRYYNQIGFMSTHEGGWIQISLNPNSNNNTRSCYRSDARQWRGKACIVNPAALDLLHSVFGANTTLSTSLFRNKFVFPV